MKKRLHLLLPLALIVLPVAIGILYLRRFAVNVPFMDQWDLVPLLEAFLDRDGRLLLELLWRHHNEHNILFPKLIFLALAVASDWNVLAEMWFSLFLTLLSLLGLWLIYRRAGFRSLWGFAPISWLALSLGQWENILWGWQLQIYLQVAAMVFALYFLSLRALRHTILAIACAVVASFSFTPGLLIWPVGLISLIALRVQKRQIVLWCLAAVVTLMLYLQGYRPPVHHPSPLAGLFSPLTSLRFFVINVGAPLGGGNIDLSCVMGLLLLCLVLVLLYRRVKTANATGPQPGRALERSGVALYYQVKATMRNVSRPSDLEILAGGLLLMSFMSSLVVTAGRVGFDDLTLALNSRYVTMTSLGIIGIYLLCLGEACRIAQQPHERGFAGSFPLLPTLLPLLFVGLSMANLQGMQMGEHLRAGRLSIRYIAQTFDSQPDEALQSLFRMPEMVRSRAESLRARGLSVFAIEEPHQADLGGKVRLLGYSLGAKQVAPGDTLFLTLHWQALEPMAESYTVFTHLLDAEGQIRAQMDSQPRRGSLPTDQWTVDQVIVDTYALAVAADAKPGPHVLEIGMYLLETLERLPAHDSTGAALGDRVLLGTVEVVNP